jgi:hypothetical protein
MSAFHLHYLSKYAIIQRCINDVSSLAIEMYAFLLRLSCIIFINSMRKAHIYNPTIHHI